MASRVPHHVSLPPSYVNIAARDLCENSQHVYAHIMSLKRWVKAMPHLTCPDKDEFYIAFLRHAKYEHAKAQIRVDNFATIRTSLFSSIREWFQYPPVSSPLVQNYLKMGIHVPLGFTNDGAYVLMIRPGVWDMGMLSAPQVIIFVAMQLDRLLEDPRVQIGGLRIFFDMDGVNTAHFTSMNPRKNIKELLRMLQEAYPIRMKGLIYYHEPPVLDMVLKFMMFWMKPKIKERIVRVKSDLDRATQLVPGLKEILPREYGGGNGTVQQIIDTCASEFVAYYSMPSLWSELSVDERKRPDAAKNFMKEYIDCYSDVMGVKGTFVKLNDED